MKPVLKMLLKGFYSYSKGDLSISVVGEPTNFYLNYTDRFTPHESSPWFKGRPSLFYNLTTCTDKEDTVKVLRDNWSCKINNK